MYIEFTYFITALLFILFYCDIKLFKGVVI